MIEISNVTKTFGSKTAVKDLSLSIKAGEVFAFLGPNGAGKTTTIKMLVGLLQPTKGKIKINNYDMSVDYIKAKQNIAYVPDQPYLYDKLTGRETLEFIGQMYNMPKKKVKEKIDYLIELFELYDYIDSLCESYSHGMKQRVVFSLALLHSPKLLIVDEPMVGLDPKSARIVKDIFIEQAKLGVTVFLSTHSLGVAEETANRIGIINLGKLITVDTLENLQKKIEGKQRLEEIFLELTL